MASLVKEYQENSKRRNITFVGICTSMTATPRSMEQQVNQFKLKPFANMLDAAGATAAAYGVPHKAANWLVVIDGDGKIAYNASKGWHWSGGPNAGKYVHQTQLEESHKRFPGILGLIELPAALELAAHYFDLQQFDLMEMELRKAEARGNTESVKLWAGKMRERVTEHRRARVQQMETLSFSEPLAAYREAQCFAAGFPQAPEKAAVQEVVKKTLALPEVKKELAAEEAFQRMLAPELKKVTSFKQFQARIPPVFEAYMKTYGGTKFAEVAKDAVEMHKKAVN